MAKGKSSSGGARNDSRPNGKASKKSPGARGVRGTKLTDLEKILMGKGLAVKYARHNAVESRKTGKKGKRKSAAA